MIESVLKSIGFRLTILTTIFYFIYKTYQEVIQPSKYMLIAEKLGFIGYEKINGEKNQHGTTARSFIKNISISRLF